MTRFPLHTIDTAPEASRPIMTGTRKANGFVPNLLATLAGSPASLEAYTNLSKTFDRSSFDATERQVVILSASVENGCDYCVAAHSTIAAALRVPEEVLDALRAEEPIPIARLEALSRFTRQVVQQRGWVDDTDVEAFVAAGFTQAQVLEVILGVTLKTLSNYANHIARPVLDDAFAPRAWSRSGGTAVA